MSTEPSLSAPSQLRREPWPLVVIGLLVAMGLVLFALLRIATSHADAVLPDDAFTAGQRISDEIAERARAEALGWRLELAAAPQVGAVRVRVRLTGPDGAALTADRVAVRRERAAEGGLDEETALVAEGDAFVGTVALPRPGSWRLQARAERAGATVRAVYDVEASR